jgi:hypothetical protein
VNKHQLDKLNQQPRQEEASTSQHDKQNQTAAQRLNQLAGYACCHGSNDVSSEKINNLAKQPMAVCIIHRLT